MSISCQPELYSYTTKVAPDRSEPVVEPARFWILKDTVVVVGVGVGVGVVVGVGVGGTFEKCAILAKRALTRPVDLRSKLPHIRELEEEILEEANRMDIGPAGLGGDTSVFAVNIETYATHIAGMPVAVNTCCHVNRHAVREL